MGLRGAQARALRDRIDALSARDRLALLYALSEVATDDVEHQLGYIESLAPVTQSKAGLHRE